MARAATHTRGPPQTTAAPRTQKRSVLLLGLPLAFSLNRTGPPAPVVAQSRTRLGWSRKTRCWDAKCASVALAACTASPDTRCCATAYSFTSAVNPSSRLRFGAACAPRGSTISTATWGFARRTLAGGGAKSARTTRGNRGTGKPAPARARRHERPAPPPDRDAPGRTPGTGEAT